MAGRPTIGRAMTRALRGVLAVAVGGVLATASITPGSARNAPLKADVSAAVANGFARLIFTFDEELDADVRVANGIVIVAFRRPVDIGIDRLPSELPGYVSVARRDPDGAAVRIALARKVTVNSMAAGDKLFVDLLPEGWAGLKPSLPQEVIDDLARRAREAEKKIKAQETAQRQQHPLAPIKVRFATLPGLARYTFELPETIPVSADRTKDKLTVVFEAALKFDIGDAKASLPPTIASLDAEDGEEKGTVTFAFIGKVDVKTFREDKTFVVDVNPSAAPDRASLPEAKTGARKEPDKAAEPSANKGVAQPLAASRPAAAENRAATKPTPAPVTSAPPSGDAQKIAAPSAAIAQPEPKPVGEKVSVPPAPGDLKAPIVPVLKKQGEIVRLIFPFRQPTSAAIFRRLDTLWLVFDSGVPIDAARFKDDPSRTVRDVDIKPSGEGQVLRLKLGRPRQSTFAADGDAWVVTLGDVVLEPTAPLSVTRVPSSQTTAIVPFDDPRYLHRLWDPDIGDTLLVVTGLGPARGFLKTQDFVEFRTLASTHGVVVQPIADDISAELAPEKIVIGRPRGLALTSAADQAVANVSTASKQVPLDVKSWKADRQADFFSRQAALVDAAANAPEGERTRARINLARFFIARDQNAEAKAVMDVAIATASDGDQRDVAPLRVLRAMSNVLMGHPAQALKDLADPSVGNRHEAPLWRAMAHAGQGRWAEASEGFKNVETLTAELPAELQRVSLKEAVRTAIELKDFSSATRRLNEFESFGVSEDLKPELTILSGKVAEGLGRVGDALTAFHSVAQSENAPAAAQAKLREIALRYSLKQMKRDAAIVELESLAATWRGDQTEIEALQLLARLYGDEQRYRDAFQIMRVAAAAHPASDITRRIQDEAAATFETLFLSEKGDALPPIEALGLFYDFRALTPVGRKGDEMIRRLAERLVTVDLLSQAAELLQHQVDHRLQGAARAQVATRLATIYLMNRKPDHALQALRATRMTDLSADLRAQRLMIEARALSDTGRHDLAFDVLANLDGRETERLRFDIQWSARRWRDAAEIIERLYGERWKDFAPLNETERADVMRAAIGYALAEDRLGIDRFRQRYAAKMAEGPDKRMFDVVTAPLNARTGEFTEIAKTAASINTLGTFLRDLRARYPEKSDALSAAPQAPRS
jgi:hypothetical protein